MEEKEDILSSTIRSSLRRRRERGRNEEDHKEKDIEEVHYMAARGEGRGEALRRGASSLDEELLMAEIIQVYS